MKYKIKPKDIDGMMFFTQSVANKGYVQDPGGDQDGRRKGYAYTYQSVTCPRLRYTHDVSLLDDGGARHIWLVDGLPCPDLPAACRRLAEEPLMSALEAFAWMRLPPDPFVWHQALQWIAGCQNDYGDSPHIIEPEGRWRLADDAFRRLWTMGLLKYTDEPDAFERKIIRNG